MRYQSFSREIATAKPPNVVVAESLAAMSTPLARHGYRLQTQTETAMVYSLTYRRWWVWVITIATFPLGLLAFLGLPEIATITISLEPRGEGTLIRISGEATEPVREAFAQMEL